MEHEIRNAFDKILCSNKLKTDTYSSVVNRLRDKKRYFSVKMKWVAAAVCFAVFAGSGFGGYQLYYTEAATISIDINPSIELGINRWGRVIEETTYGEDSEKILSMVDLKHMEYQKAMEQLLSSAAMSQYLGGGSLISITLESGDKEEQLFKDLQDCVDKTLEKCHDGVKAEYASVDKHLCRAAHEQGMSVGKYNAIQEILAVDPRATVEEFQDKSMKEIKGHMKYCEHGLSEQTDQYPEERQSGGGCSDMNDGYGHGHHGKTQYE